MTFWTGPKIHEATTLFGFTGFTAMAGSVASLRVKVPGNRNPSSQLPTGLGCESSTSGPSWEFCAAAVNAQPKQASAMPARPTPNFFSAARRVTDWARLLVTSSNLSFLLFLSFGLFLFLITTDFTDDADKPHCPTRRAKMLVMLFASTAPK